MDIFEAKSLRESVKDKNCPHTHIEKEEMFGAHTGDYVCISCGKIIKEIKEEGK